MKFVCGQSERWCSEAVCCVILLIASNWAKLANQHDLLASHIDIIDASIVSGYASTTAISSLYSDINRCFSDVRITALQWVHCQVATFPLTNKLDNVSLTLPHLLINGYIKLKEPTNLGNLRLSQCVHLKMLQVNLLTVEGQTISNCYVYTQNTDFATVTDNLQWSTPLVRHYLWFGKPLLIIPFSA